MFLLLLGIGLGLLHLALIVGRCAHHCRSKVIHRQRVAPAVIEVQPADLRAAAVRASRQVSDAAPTESATSMTTPSSDRVVQFYDDQRPSPISNEPEWEADWESEEVETLELDG